MGHHINKAGEFQNDKPPILKPDNIRVSFKKPASWRALRYLAQDYHAVDDELSEDIDARLDALGAPGLGEDDSAEEESKPTPTLEELEAILAAEEEAQIEVLPNGELRVRETCCYRGCARTDCETFEHDSLTRACGEHVELLRPWL